MGYIRNEFLIVHTFPEDAAEARAAALSIFPASMVGPVMRSPINHNDGFVVWTSGSKLGWSDADEHSGGIDRLIAKLSEMERPPRWVRVKDGEEPGDIEATQGSDGNWTHSYETHTAKCPERG